MRTAPFPNIPAIPGMNPGIWLMGGGGGMGGASGNTKNPGKGKQGAGGKGAGENATGGGNCAGSGGMGCPVHAHSPSAGDPVELATGRAFTNPVTDLKLAGPIPFEFKRSYSSASWAIDVGLGPGWSHSFAWNLHCGRRDAEVLSGRGERVQFDVPPKDGSTVASAEGWQLWREDDGFVLDAMDGVLRRFRPATEPNYYRLVEVFDQNKNTIRFEYEGPYLAKALDCVGRHITFRRDNAGHLVSLDVYNAVARGQWVSFAGYQYDQDSDLVEVVNADGARTRFRYQKHRMTEAIGATGLVFHYRYNEDDFCIETWGDYPGHVDESLADDVPATLADGVTPAKGVHHVKITFSPDGYVEIADSLQVQRVNNGKGHGGAEKTVSAGSVTTRVFDEFGYLRELTDPLGNTTIYERDDRGRILAETNPLGQTTKYTRDERGLPIEIVKPDGSFEVYGYDKQGNIISITDGQGGTTQYTRDTRGLVTDVVDPSGAIRQFRHDAMGNVTSFVEPTGAVTTIEYDFFGRPVSLRGPLGATVYAGYTTGGRCTSMRDADGSITQYVFDGVGRVTDIMNPMGQTYRYRYAGYDRLVAIEAPGGDVTRYKYDREGRCVEAWNEKSETYRAKFNPMGLVREETFFDGRSVTYKRDAMGFVTEKRASNGDVTKFEYDALGRVVKKTFPDGTEHEFQWDACGRPIGMRSPAGEFLLQRNAAGDILKEIQVVDGQTFEVRHSVDRAGRNTEISGNFGYSEFVERDPAGNPLRIRTSDGAELTFQRDVRGGEIARTFGAGGRLELDFDIVGNLTRLRARATRKSGFAPNVPVVGAPVGPDVTFERQFSYNAISEVVSTWDTLRKSSIEYGYNGQHRLTSQSVDGQTRGQWDYDGPGNAYLRGEPRRYGAGNRLEQRNTDAYDYDEHGRIIEKRRSIPGGGVEQTRYHWNAMDMLEKVEMPDGAVVSFQYDPIGRRVLKNVERKVAGRIEQSTTRFVWDGDRLVHEIRRKAAASGDPIIEERTYGWSERALVPWGMRIRRNGNDDDVTWAYYVLDQAGMPMALTDASGEVLCEYERKAWGELVPRGESRIDSPIRAQGQYADEEIGLHYNRNRYYDPESGRYISPDPLGVLPDLNQYKYGDNPITDVDPFGLAPHIATAELETADGTTHPIQNPQSNSPLGRNEFASGYAGTRYDNADAHVQGRKKNGASFGTLWQDSHSEFKIMRELSKRGDLRGSTARISGGSRSCNNCAVALEDFARANQMRIEYSTPGAEDLVIDHREGGTGENNRVPYNQRTRKQQRRR
ncbi:MAG TPA: RHS repeat-associated core domain-containing protein [Polyangium sp.]|nr:RHS repeat-associated core domain-containing protein [Polyangium sp.]